LEQGLEPFSLGIDYNQKHIIESQFALAQCAQLNVERKVIKVTWDKPVRNIPTGRSLKEIKEGVSVAFLEGRNIVFLALACAESAGIRAEEIWLGINAIDYSGYPDCRPEFIESFQNMLGFGYPNGPKIKSPLLNLTKPEIAQEAYRLGIAKGDTWSCYRPRVSQKGVEPCHECDACVLHDYAWNSITLSEVAPDVKFKNLTFR
jgi:7-cyano-7-deazaguanine synthase